MEIRKLKDKACSIVDENKGEIIKLTKDLFEHPETGYKEYKTSELIKEKFRKLNFDIEEEIAITGIKTSLGNVKKPHIAVLGELDAIIDKDHPKANEYGVVHSCGHNNQIGIMFGVALALKKTRLMESLNGTVDFIATPAEEYIELEFREKLKKDKKIKYFGGKQELISRGYFDDVDLALMVHSFDTGEMKDVIVGPSGNGFIAKKVKFFGKKAHAGSSPEEGINALNAAVLAINNINAQRDTFLDSDNVRVHPIITKGGDVVNTVPSDVRMETYVRARTLDSIIDTNKKVDRALKAAAIAMGAEVEIKDYPGYLPLLSYDSLVDLFIKNSDQIIDKNRIIRSKKFSGSFDMGDLSHIMPVLHPFFGGVKGGLHTSEFKTVDYELAVIKPAKVLIKTIIDILTDEDILKTTSNPPYSRDKYKKILNKINSD
ncbi:MAG: amidohydrolase [Halanaerobiales bacterium]|nr:amidohydrolase [Halanaerobiales bacterium]